MAPSYRGGVLHINVLADNFTAGPMNIWGHPLAVSAVVK
jgi:hypothetical protein